MRECDYIKPIPYGTLFISDREKKRILKKMKTFMVYLYVILTVLTMYAVYDIYKNYIEYRQEDMITIDIEILDSKKNEEDNIIYDYEDIFLNDDIKNNLDVTYI